MPDVQKFTARQITLPDHLSVENNELFDWQVFVRKLDIAFQPIVNIHTGVCFGYEALARDWENGGFSSIQDILDAAYSSQRLTLLESLLREKILRKYVTLPHYQQTILFLNLDNRSLHAPDKLSGDCVKLITELGIETNMICLKISGKQPVSDYDGFCRYCQERKKAHFKVAIDDFGSGFSGLQLLYFAEPDFIKIDRFFINDIAKDAKKKLFVEQVVNLAHILGSTVIAGGVETEKEYYVCKDIGCDYIQGFFVQKPTTNLGDLHIKYKEIAWLGKTDKRCPIDDEKIIIANIDFISPIVLAPEQGNYDGLEIILNKFRQNKERTFFPLLNKSQEPLGIIREKHLKDYVYTKYGCHLLMNKSLRKKVQDFLSFCPVMEQTLSIENLLEVFSLSPDPEGIMLTNNGKYVGFLSSAAIIKILNEKNLAIARDQNPLSKMPGNNLIGEFLSRAYDDKSTGYVFVYFDFNDFKPFNDYYGFRRGDRAILMFADLLKKSIFSSGKQKIAGHLGGDDFFVASSLYKTGFIEICGQIEEIINKFQQDAGSLYDQSDRDRGFILSIDRSGAHKKFGLLSLSTAILVLEPGSRSYSMEDITRCIASLKKEAKQNVKNKTVIRILRQNSDNCSVENACQICVKSMDCTLVRPRQVEMQKVCCAEN